MKRSRFVISIVMTLMILGSTLVSLLSIAHAGAQTTGSFAVTSVSKSCEADELIVNVENTTGQEWSLEVLFANSSDSSSYPINAGNQGLNQTAVVPHNGAPFDEVILTIWLNDGWRFSYGSFVGLCGESFVPEFQGSWAPSTLR